MAPLIVAEIIHHFCISNYGESGLPVHLLCWHRRFLQLAEYRLPQKAIPAFLRCLSLSFFFLWGLETLQRANSFLVDGWRLSSQSCEASSAMLRCTYYNPNRVMAAGYLHAVRVTFLSLQFVCVVQSAQLSDVNITVGHRTECDINEEKKRKDAPTRMMDAVYLLCIPPELIVFILLLLVLYLIIWFLEEYISSRL